MIKFVTQHDLKIRKKEVKGEAQKYIILLSGHKESKRGSFFNYHDTWEEAKKFLIDRQQDKIDKLIDNLLRANLSMESIKVMKNENESNHHN